MSNQKYKNKRQKGFNDKNKKDSQKKKEKGPISGFSTLNQVAGVPHIREHHSEIPVLPVRTVKEPYPICPRCNQKIENITSSFLNSNGEYVHFDCVLEDLKEHESLKDGQVISYIGSGNFGVCEKNEEGKWTILKTINYESSEKNKEIKGYIEGLKS